MNILAGGAIQRSLDVIRRSCLPENARLGDLGGVPIDLAAGRFDVFWEMHLKTWDIAAGVLIVREAGGMVSDFQGGESFLATGHIIACTPKLFKPTLKIIAKHLGHVR